MEDHQLHSFINTRMQFGDLKYKTAVESLLFDQDNQELIININEIFQKHLQLFKTLKQNNLQEDHINAVISKQILGDGIIEKKLVSNLFVTEFSKIFGQNQYNLAKATIKFKNHMTSILKIQPFKDTAIDELLKDREIQLQFDLEETKQFMTQQTQDQQFDFMKNYILFNLQNNENFSYYIKLWKQKFGCQNDEQLKSKLSIQVHFIDWIEQVKQIIDRLWMPYYSKLEVLYQAESNDQQAFKPLQLISDIYEKKKANYFIIDSLINQIKNHEYNFDKIQVAFSHGSPKEVLISFLELLDWCQDIQKWEKIIFSLVQNIKMEYITTQSYQISLREGGFNMDNYLDEILKSIIIQYEEKSDPQKQIHFFDLDSLDESNFEGMLYEIKKDGIDFYYDKLMVCGNITLNFGQKGKIEGKIGQVVMDISQVQMIYIGVNQNSQDFLLPLWRSDKLKARVIKLILFRVAQCINIETQKKDKIDKIITIDF